MYFPGLIEVVGLQYVDLICFAGQSIQLKVQQSCHLIDNSGLLIADVSREAGFDDQFYFSRVLCKVK
jgi:AraC-like DNA-binding protein